MAETNPAISSHTEQWSLPLKRAKQRGSGIIGVYNTSHCGMAGYYVDMARKADIIGLLFADCLPRITPEGGTEAILGNKSNRYRDTPLIQSQFCFDMSTAAITNGDLLVAMREGTPIAEGIAFSPEGEPTTDAGRSVKKAVSVHSVDIRDLDSRS